ncbi:MAG: preprotein translocase subunit YajC [Gammaproteobacteria bacterium]|jgi:preprotein translocase subunit YajC
MDYPLCPVSATTDSASPPSPTPARPVQIILDIPGIQLGVILQGSAPNSDSTGSANTAETGAGGGSEEEGSGPGNIFLPMIAIFAIFYFILIRPEQKKSKAKKVLMGSLKKGTKVMTTSGLYGTVSKVQEDVITLVVADGVRLRFNRAAIQDITNPEQAAKDGEKDSKKDDGSDNENQAVTERETTEAT